jgi:hypothetical protein
VITTLFTYMKDVQRLLHEQKQDLINPNDLIAHINTARREVAMRAQCLRVLPNITGSIVGWSIPNGGTGYSSSPTLSITPPDAPSGQAVLPNGAQATAVAIVTGGVISSIESTYGGAGYFQPIMTITDSTGSGATATPIMSPMFLLKQGQEVYNFSDIDLSAFPGIDSAYYCRSASVIYSNYRYSLPCYAFTIYQALIRQYPSQYQYVPTMFSQFGQGASGSLYFYPLPSQSYQCELDLLCLPSDLVDNQSYEALPAPWTEAVKYFAAGLCFQELVNLNAATFYESMFDKRLLAYSGYARIGRATNPYGRY